MPCLSFKAKNSSGFICSADMHREKQRCCVGGRPAEDWEIIWPDGEPHFHTPTGEPMQPCAV